MLREERDARIRFEATMREERAQVRTLLRELSSQFEVMAGQIEQITVFIGIAHSMHTSPPVHRKDPVPTDPHTSTSRGVGTSLDPPATDSQLPAVQDPILESPCDSTYTAAAGWGFHFWDLSRLSRPSSFVVMS